ncbi:MAG TPA: penicillin-binding transpeptidase domain-containing protein [Nocardioides sp.]|uniref:penicillin-binding transpeptidase domain-containing protein n=1 Tax=Nocardioides sp. TaxID=35761 RepID=UPI002D1BAEBF|nr:penicillin-binding transpeptidase domain-containing protein [Nocardioides sp.]HTW16080.1 penicillin-binding transpeptidase domain-containing protein [Nocardioides sp.]
MRPPLQVPAAVLLVAGLLSSCDQVSGRLSDPEPDQAAADLATGLAGGDLSAVTFSGTTAAEATAAYAAVVEGLGDLEPTVTLDDVASASDGASTATLAWSWPVGAAPWEYTSEAPLELVDDEWRVVWSPAVVEPSLTDGEVLDATTIAARRGDITGAEGKTLVTLRPVVRLGIDRSAVPKPEAVAAARRLADLVEIDAAAYSARVEKAGEAAFVEAITYRSEDVPPAAARAAETEAAVLAVQDELPLGPTREFAAPILGTVGEVTAEMVEEDPDTYRPGDEAGLSGLQSRYDDLLRGEPGVVVHAVATEDEAAEDAAERELHRVDPQAGGALELTLDPDLQQEAERQLAGVRPASALVALRPSTGEIVAAANGPGTDGYNMATFGQFAPGSTFKAVTSLALLRAGLTPATPVPCTPTIVVDGKSFKNYSDYPSGALGRIPLRTAIANSCNTALISQTDRLGDTGLYDAAVSLGMGLDHDLGFPAFLGSVKDATSKTEAAAATIGQGTVLASPMVMATVIGSVQQGELVIPRLVRSVEVTAPDGAQPLKPGEAKALKSMLREVVTAGSGRALADVPGGPVIAKTGTAEFGSDPVRTHAWMIAAQGDLAVAVFVEIGESGSQTAGPILEAFLRAAR